MTTQQMDVPASFNAKVRGVDFPLTDIQSWPKQSLAKVLEYGLQRIFNDSAASAKSDAEAVELAGKRLDNLRAGIIRASGTRIGDPVKRRAMELAVAAVQRAPKFQAWLAEAKLKASDKDAIKRRNELAAQHVEAYMAQAKIDVEAAQALPVLELEI